MQDVRYGDGVIAKRHNGKKQFGTINGRFGNKLGVMFSDRSIEFLEQEHISPLYSIPQDFGILIDNNPYHYPCKFSDYDWQLKVERILS